MYFHKYPHPSNFEFAGRLAPNRPFRTRLGRCTLHAGASKQDIYRIQVQGDKWETNDSIAGLELPEPATRLTGADTRLVFERNGSVRLLDKAGNPLLASLPGLFFGQKGEASVFAFHKEEGDLFYGLGEKWSGLEHSGKTTKFWNTDVWGDFHPEAYIHGKPDADPVYVSIPYLIVKRGNACIGLLLDNPNCTFISTSYRVSIANQLEVAGAGHECMYLGAEKGQPSLYILYGPSLAALTRKMQKLVGVTPLPPAWALGYHQCRWGYESEAHLLELDSKFREHAIPVDGLWLDIDYMDGYRVFTFAKKHFRNPAAVFAKLKKSGRRVVPIIDPGVKNEKGYAIYERGMAAGAFCLNPQGLPYVGLVWPGETVFPDFSLASARAWWAREVHDFARLGLHGAWLDMNDPSTGPIDNMDMLFDRGRKDHGSFHNQYALGMAMATREGFLKAWPDERPFLLCRSGSVGTSRHTAIWTGDNYSNYHHLRTSIPTTLNLALSGIPFNGPDVGGFGGDTTPELLRDWYKAVFLFPVLRNHSIRDSRHQEPWAFDRETLEIVRSTIRLRYRFRPYLYQLFAAHERTGDAILRPLIYDFPDTPELPIGRIDDQFMVGPGVMQAPFLREGQKTRQVVLPGGTAWYDTASGRWLKGGRTLKVTVRAETTPLYVRDGSILPLARLEPGDHAFDSRRIDFHVFLSANDTAETRYLFDDGISFAYRRGGRSETALTATRSGASMSITIELVADGFGQGDFTFTTEAAIRKVTVNGRPAAPCAPQGVALGGGKMKTWSASSS